VALTHVWHATPHSRVEVEHLGEWGTVCGEGFSRQDARVTCRAMGFKGDKVHYKFGHDFYREAISAMPIWIHAPLCSGDEVMLEHCEGVHKLHDRWNKRSCENHDSDVGVCCFK
jgi:hypothetical protein